MKRKITSSRGVALMMVMGAMTILTALLVQFIHETQTNKYKITRQQSLFKARLMAESGLTLALARLRLYQETLNTLNQQEEMKNAVKANDLNIIWQTPFHFPLNQLKNLDVIQRNALEEFSKNMIIDGEMTVDIQSQSQRFNINFLREVSAEFLPKKTPPAETDPTAPAAPEAEEENSDKENQETLSKSFLQLLQKKLEEKKESTENYEELYGDVSAETLIHDLQFFISDEDALKNTDLGDIPHLYQNIKPKHAPLSSLSELSYLASWKQAHIELIRNDITVHGNRVIDINNITENILRLIFPDLGQEQIQQFFRFRDRPDNPKEKVVLSSEADFQDFICNRLKFYDKKDYEERIKKLRSAGLDFGVNGHLFQVTSRGSYQQQTPYTLSAMVLIPARLIPPPPPVKPSPEGLCPDTHELNDKKTWCIIKPKKDAQGRIIPPTYEYFLPRVVELVVQGPI
jgi:type II secretory pathway component PulK